MRGTRSLRREQGCRRAGRRDQPAEPDDARRAGARRRARRARDGGARARWPRSLEMEKQRFVSSFELAHVHTALGERERARSRGSSAHSRHASIRWRSSRSIPVSTCSSGTRASRAPRHGGRVTPAARTRPPTRRRLAIYRFTAETSRVPTVAEFAQRVRLTPGEARAALERLAARTRHRAEHPRWFDPNGGPVQRHRRRSISCGAAARSISPTAPGMRSASSPRSAPRGT